MSLSLDGSTAFVHDGFRGVKGSFDQTLARIHGALDIDLSIQVNTTVSRHTVEDLPRVFDLLTGIRGIALWDLFFLVHDDVKQVLANFDISEEEMLAAAG